MKEEEERKKAQDVLLKEEESRKEALMKEEEERKKIQAASKKSPPLEDTIVFDEKEAYVGKVDLQFHQDARSLAPPLIADPFDMDLSSSDDNQQGPLSPI